MNRKLHAKLLIDEQVFKRIDKKDIDDIKVLLKSKLDKLVKNDPQRLKDFHINIDQEHLKFKDYFIRENYTFKEVWELYEDFKSCLGCGSTTFDEYINMGFTPGISYAWQLDHKSRINWKY